MNNNEFKWTNELIFEFVNFYEESCKKKPTWTSEALEEFKKSKQPSVKEEPSFQILSFTDNKELIILREDGKYEYEVSIICHSYTLHEMLEVGRSVKSGDIKIHSVKRNSDGEVFTVGDKVSERSLKDCKIKSIYLKNNETLVWLTTNIGYDYGVNLDYAKKEPLKQKIFTCNGVDYFHGDHYFRVLKDFSLRENVALEVPDEDHLSDCIVFQTKQLAEDYIMINKPVPISFNDLHNYSMDTMCYSKFFIEFFRSKTLG